MKCNLLYLDITHYSHCYNLQKRIHREVRHDGADDYLIITEHYPVITIGRSGSKKNLLVSEEFLKSRGVKLAETDRGGDITYHGPGQIIMYPIIDLKRREKIGTVPVGDYPYFLGPDLHKYLHYLEDTVIAVLAEFNVNSFIINGKTGVWTKQGKIASIGIGVSGWVTFHGVALNVECDLTPFGWINPCGFKDIKVTSIEQDLIGKIDKGQIKQRLIEIFCEKFGFKNLGKLEHCSRDRKK